MENISRDIPRRLDFDCFHNIFDAVNAEVFVVLRRRTADVPGIHITPIVEIIEDKIRYEANKKNY